jgi:CDP-diacylglycerol--glycerol-3-phosphate 3-phosphatidyltransferase
VRVFPVNVPNVLTVLRILLVPVLVVALLDETPNGDQLAAAVFAIASLTDLLDGYLARSRNSITTFGKLMDPIADKLLVIAALVSLVSLGRVAAWVAMVIIAREFAVTALRMAATSQGVVISASMFGKAKTCFQIAMVMALIIVGDPLWVDLLVYVTVAVTVASGADYFFGLRRTLGNRDRAQARAAAALAARGGSGSDDDARLPARLTPDGPHPD